MSHYSQLTIALSKGFIHDNHRLMIVTADSQDETRRWTFGTLTDVLISKLMGQTHPLRLMFYGLSIHNRMLELLHDGFVNSVALTSP